jgi:hypothetical protein
VHSKGLLANTQSEQAVTLCVFALGSPGHTPPKPGSIGSLPHRFGEYLTSYAICNGAAGLHLCLEDRAATPLELETAEFAIKLSAGVQLSAATVNKPNDLISMQRLWQSQCGKAAAVFVGCACRLTHMFCRACSRVIEMQQSRDKCYYVCSRASSSGSSTRNTFVALSLLASTATHAFVPIACPSVAASLGRVRQRAGQHAVVFSEQVAAADNSSEAAPTLTFEADGSPKEPIKLAQSAGARLLPILKALDVQAGPQRKAAARTAILSALKRPRSFTSWELAQVGAACATHFDKELLHAVVTASTGIYTPSIAHMTIMVDAAAKAQR